MNVILKFIGTEEDTKRIEKKFIKTLSDLYLKRLLIESHDRAHEQLSKEKFTGNN